MCAEECKTNGGRDEANDNERQESKNRSRGVLLLDSTCVCLCVFLVGKTNSFANFFPVLHGTSVCVCSVGASAK